MHIQILTDPQSWVNLYSILHTLLYEDTLTSNLITHRYVDYMAATRIWKIAHHEKNGMLTWSSKMHAIVIIQDEWCIYTQMDEKQLQ
jgi:hypothetical protein